MKNRIDENLRNGLNKLVKKIIKQYHSIWKNGKNPIFWQWVGRRKIKIFSLLMQYGDQYPVYTLQFSKLVL